jgi:hypothetical protein
MQHQVHRREAGGALHQLPAAQRVLLQMFFLVARKVGVVLRHIVVREEQKPAGAAGRVANGLAGPGRDAVHHRRYQRARREILSRAAFRILRVLLQQALVGVAFHVRAHGGPVLGVDQVHHQAPQLGRVLELVLRLVENEGERALAGAELLQRVAIVVEQIVAVALEQREPGVGLGDEARLLVRRARTLVGHLEEQQIGELLDVIAVAHAVVAQDVAVIPEFLDDGGGVHLCPMFAKLKPRQDDCDLSLARSISQRNALALHSGCIDQLQVRHDRIPAGGTKQNFRRDDVHFATAERSRKFALHRHDIE